MTWTALKMLTGNRAKYFAIIFGVSFACMLMTQQSSIFVGLMRNTASQIRDIQGADVWVMDPSVQFIEDVTPLTENDLYRVRGVPGVKWAVVLFKSMASAQLENGSFKNFSVIGLDDQTLVGAPAEMLIGSVGDLRRPDAVILDERGYQFLFPGQQLRVGWTVEMNDHRAVIVGICKSSPSFQTYPVAYTPYSRAIFYAPQERRFLSFILAQGEPGVPVEEICDRIQQRTGLMALSGSGFMWRTITYYLQRTGIPVNFGITVLLGFIIGAAVAGQTFYLFTLDNLKQFGALKAMGVTNRRIVGMVLTQALVVGAFGYAIGVGLASILEELLMANIKGVPPAMFMTWQIPVGTAVAAALIVGAAALVSVRRVLVLEPAAVFR
ncbi:MAG TPA: ABC transporter permease [Gemmataceae bacterium]|nr:ABC transporter permease [Gemmataceae bacterium]